MNAFTLTKLLATREHLGDLYHEFLRVPSMCAGVCQLTAGATDPQEQHTEDELYYIVQGKALLKVGNEDIPVEPGSLVFVAAHIEHRFHTITEDLTAHVFFAPAECSLDTREKEASISDPQFRRERSVTWQDPRVAAEASQTMSGLELIKAIQVGELPAPPIAELIGMWVAEASEGRVVIAIEPAEHHYSNLGMVHGGIAATLLDTAMGLAVVSMLPAATGFTTLELKVNYVRPITDKTGVMYCEGKIIHMGSRIATAEGRLTGASGKLYAHGTTTCLVSRQESLPAKG